MLQVPIEKEAAEFPEADAMLSRKETFFPFVENQTMIP
jgi:hypothetical protein